MHVGHLRSTIIGDSLARLFEFLGHDVLRLNHIGDWGTSFGMLIAYIKEEHPHLVTGEENIPLSVLMQWYQASKKRFDAEPEFKKRSQNEVVALQSNDPINLKIWEKICEISRIGYQEIYDLLDIHLNERGESFYNPMLKEVVDDLEKKGLVTISDGAKCIFVPAHEIPLMVQKSDGGYNYDTTDMAALLHRVNIEKAEKIIYVVDQGQALHFDLVIQSALLAGYFDPNKVHIEHVPFGLVLGTEGKKFRTRSGETEKELMDLLLAAIDKAETIIKEKNPELTEQEVKELAHIIGLSSVKYADLSNHRAGDYQFSYDKMLRFEGNTAPYLLYAYVRTQGIARQSAKKAGKIHLTHPQEQLLALKLLQFHDVLKSIERELIPHKLTEYLFDLANSFNAFFRDCRVVGSEEEESRLALVALVGKTLQKGLNILGIKTVDKM